MKITNTIFDYEQRFVNSFNQKENESYKISLNNYIHRKNNENLMLLNSIQVGDICFFDFGNAYKYEIGYQHLGIVLKISNKKIFIVPLISFRGETLDDLYDINNNPNKMYIPSQGGLQHDSVALLNDTKWINYMRVVKNVGHINPTDDIFTILKFKVLQLIMG